MAKMGCAIVGILLVGVAAMAKADETRQTTRAPDAEQNESVESLRAEGAAGLERLQSSYDRLCRERDAISLRATTLNQREDRQTESLASLEQRRASLESQIDALRCEIDQVGGQRGCSVSRLYWYTDLAKAEAEAKRTGRSILSLRMLGKLTDEYSCANSRFFRTALYSNKEISDFLRTNFVLHWQSVRPVPRVTIDFGDGRKLERTLTGNSAHYVLASDGTPLDVLPGLYGPLAFRQWLTEMKLFHSRYVAAPIENRAVLLKAFHRNQEMEVLQRWDQDIARLGARRIELVSSRINEAMNTMRDAKPAASNALNAPQAVVAAQRAVGKTQVEAPVLRFANLGGTWMERGMDDDLWKAVADLHRSEVKLDGSSVAVMGREFPRAAIAGKLAVTKSRQENPVLRMVRTFEDSMTLDTVRNEYLLHRRVHEKFAKDVKPPRDVDELNEWVYAELFLTPSRDPWLGLAPNDVYTALENDGRVEAQPTTGNGGE